MRILLVNVTCNQGSTGKITYDLYNQLNDMGHAAAVCYGRGPDFDSKDIVKISSNASVKMHALKTRLTGYVGTGNNKATNRLIEFTKSFKPDVVHLHNLHGYYVNAYEYLKYLKAKNIKTILTMHDEWIFTGKCGYHYDCMKWEKSCGNCPQLSAYPKSFWFDRTQKELNIKQNILKDFYNIIYAPVASWLGQDAKQSKHISDKTVKVVHNGIETTVFKPQDTSKLKKKYKDKIKGKSVVLHVTPNFNDPRKGGKYVLKLAKALENKNIHFFIIGMPQDKIQSLPKNITGIPKTKNQTQLAKFYSFADLFLITSQMECLPTVVVESICCGTPVIGFDRGGASEAAPNNLGDFVPYGDMKKLQEATLKALSPQSALATSEQCSDYGLHHYSKQTMTENYLNLYNSF